MAESSYQFVQVYSMAELEHSSKYFYSFIRKQKIGPWSIPWLENNCSIDSLLPRFYTWTRFKIK
jgi:hypothetical protein